MFLFPVPSLVPPPPPLPPATGVFGVWLDRRYYPHRSKPMKGSRFSERLSDLSPSCVGLVCKAD